MASFAMEEFMGDGVLTELIPRFVAAGWDDVPTIKLLNQEDMDWLRLTHQQKDALELRTYLHDRSLMQYANKLEASKVTLSELHSMSTVTISSQFGMKRGHVARFVNRESSCRTPMPSSYVPPPRKKSMSCANESCNENERAPNNDTTTNAKSALDLKLNEGHVFKGIVAANPAHPRLCGCIQPPPVAEDVAPYSSIANISVQKLNPQYKFGVENLVSTKAPPMKASALWNDKPTIMLCIRRPGCIMCRAEAHQLYSRKPIFDALGFQLVAVLHEQIESEVKEFWPRYWGGIVILDQTMGFFKALGGGKLLKDNFLTGFVLNSRAIANYKAAKATGFEQNYKGQGEIKGGMFIIRSGSGGVAYQFVERNFGDWAPIGEVVEICSQIQNEMQIHGQVPKSE